MRSGRRRIGPALTVAGLAMACLAGLGARSPAVWWFVGVAVVVAATAVGVTAGRHARVARRLRATSTPGILAEVAVRWCAFSASAGVAGLRRPEVFCDPALRGRLGDRELRAVVLHERHHQLRRDPRRLVALAAVRPLVLLLPGGRRWLEWQHARIEIAADRYALERGATRAGLAGALLALARDGQPSPAAGFTPAPELRLRALVDPELPVAPRPWRVLLVALLAAVVAACVAGLVHHAVVSVGLACVWPGC